MSKRDIEKERLVKLMKEAESKFDGTPLDIEEFVADYLIANGVICPPCKVGDTIYQTDGVRIYPSTIHEITYTSSKVIFVTENIVFDEQAINNSIFLTREEAEKALERSKGNA